MRSGFAFALKIAFLEIAGFEQKTERNQFAQIGFAPYAVTAVQNLPSGIGHGQVDSRDSWQCDTHSGFAFGWTAAEN